MVGCANMDTLFDPKTIAVIGASANTQKIGYTILDNIISGGYKGEVFPINPKGGEILGKRVYKSISELTADIDMAIIAIPAKFVFDVVKELPGKNTKFVLIISSGFSEIGHAEEEKKLVEFANKNNMRILGPNIFGLYSARSNLNATFGPKAIEAGSVAIITQSGALGLAMIGKTDVENIGLSSIISVGNKSDIDEADLLGCLMNDEKTKVVLMYIEGVKDGVRFINALKKVTKKKPVVVIKTGRSKRGAQAAASHTGSLAGEDEVFDDIMEQCGALRAETVRDAFDWCTYFSTSPTPKGENVVIITNGGGIGVLATDACEKYGLRLLDNKKLFKGVFSDVTPDFGSTKNPIDLTGGATSEHYNKAMDAALNNPDMHAVMALYCETAVFDAENLGPVVKDNTERFAKAGKPIVFTLFGGEETEKAITTLRDQKLHAASDVYSAVSRMGALYKHWRQQKKPKGSVPALPVGHDMIAHVIENLSRNLISQEIQQIMRAAKIDIPKTSICTSKDEAIRIANEIGYPVVLKVVSKDIVHKADVGGVKLGIHDDDELTRAYQEMIHNVTLHNKDAVVEGIEVSEQVRPGTEVIVGARKDPVFGPIVMFGIGGTYVEVLKDVVFRAAPLGVQDAREMILDTKLHKILEGVRGEPKKDIDAIVDVILKLSDIIARHDKISDIEINPVMVYEDGVKALDVKVMLR